MPNDPILKKAMQRRDVATREMKRWDEWIKTYVELSDSMLESLDIPTPKNASAGDLDPTVGSEPGNGQALWPRAVS